MKLETTLNTDATELTLSYCMSVFRYGLTKALIGELWQHINDNLQDSENRAEVLEWHDANISNNKVIPPLAVSIRLLRVIRMSGSEIRDISEDIEETKMSFKHAVTLVEAWAEQHGMAE